MPEPYTLPANAGLLRSTDPRVMTQMTEEGASFGRMLREPAAREAFTAFMEKRKPDFSKV